jgi:hypothetical protein
MGKTYGFYGNLKYLNAKWEFIVQNADAKAKISSTYVQ